MSLTEDRKFEYLLNAMEHAAQQLYPADHGYADKRAAVFSYVAELREQLAAARVNEARYRARRDSDWCAYDEYCGAVMPRDGSAIRQNSEQFIAQYDQDSDFMLEDCHGDYIVGPDALAAPKRKVSRPAERCPKCGYSYEDCQTHLDHSLCGEPTPRRGSRS